jgi:hypothetical protein
MQAVGEHLAALDRQLIQGRLTLEAAESGLLTRAGQILSEAAPELAAQRCVELIAHLDRLAASYPGSTWKPLQDGVQQARALAAQAVAGRFRLHQANGPEAGVGGPALPISAPLVLATGISSADGTVLQPAQCILSAPAAPATAQAAWALLDELYALLAAGGRPKLKSELAAALPELAKASAAGEDSTHLRVVLNLHTRWSERADTPAVLRACTVLKAAGLRLVPPPVGERFDPDRLDLKRFDRVAREAREPAGTIVAVRQLGFSDATGLPVQKCILIVAE